MAIGQAEQDLNLSHLESNVLGESFFTRVTGQVEVQVGQVNFWSSLASYVLEPMLQLKWA